MPNHPLQPDLFGRRAATTGPRTRARAVPAGQAWMRGLRRRGWMLAPLTVIGLAAGWALCHWEQPRFRATAQVIAQSAPAAVHFAGEESPSPPDSAVAAQTLAEALGSRAAMQAAINELPGAQQARLVNYQWKFRPARNPDLMRAALEQLHVAVATGSRTLELQFEAPDAAVAMAMLRSLLQAEAAQTAARQQAAAQSRVHYLSARVQDARDAAAAAATAAATVAAHYGLADPALELNIANQRWQQLAASETTADITALQEADALQAGAFHITAQDGDAADVAGDPVDLQGKRAAAAAEVSRLAALYRPQAAPLVQARQQLASLDASLAALRQQAHEERQHALDAARRQSDDLSQALAREAQHQARLQQAEHDWELAQSALTSDRLVYSNLLDQLQQALAESGEATPPFEIIDPPFAPARPVRPHLLALLAQALALTWGLGGVGLWGWERMRDKLGRDEAGELGVPVVARLPRATGRPDFRAGIEGLASTLLLARAESDARVVVFSGVDRDNDPAELVLALAQQLTPVSHAGILLLDGNFGQPRLHTKLGGEVAPGLREVLSERVPLAAALHPCEAGSGLCYIPAGSETGAASLAVLLASGAASDLITAARARYDWILVDAGPVLPRPEAGLWAGLADAAVLVADAGRSSRRRTRAALDRLESSGVPAVALALAQVRGRRACIQPAPGWGSQTSSPQSPLAYSGGEGAIRLSRAS